MRPMIATLLCLCFALGMSSIAQAKAHLIVVFQGQTDAALAQHETALAQKVADAIAAIPGYDARLVPSSGTPGQAAQKAGAEEYLVVKAVMYDDGSELIVVSSFSVRDDEPLAVNRVRLQDWVMPPDFQVASLIGVTGMSTPVGNNDLRASAGVAMPNEGTLTLLPGGTQVIVHLTDSLSSSSAAADQTFAFQAAQDVSVGGWIVIKKGAPGVGTVVQADGAAGNGHAGKLVLQFDYITGVDGMKIQLSDSNTTATGEEKKGASSTATIIGYAFLGLPGLFAHNLVRGKQMDIDPSMKFTIFVDHSVHVAASEQVMTQPGFAK